MEQLPLFPVQGQLSAVTAPQAMGHYVIDPEGRLRLLFPFGLSVEEMADDS
jgi:hypothetical protein